MVKIYAKYGTNEKVMIFQDIPDIQIILQMKFGGEWLLVDQIKSNDEALVFTDTNIYKGYHPDIKRYADIVQTELRPTFTLPEKPDLSHE